MSAKRKALAQCAGSVLDDVFEDANEDTIVDAIMRDVIATLRRDPRMPKLSLDDWELLLADIHRRGCEDICTALRGYARLAKTGFAYALEDHDREGLAS